MNKSFGITLATIFTTVGLSHADPAPKPKRDSSNKGEIIGSVKPYVIYVRRPDYPYHARSLRLTGSGMYMVYVRPDGTVSSVRVFKSTGHTELDDAAMLAFAHWRFRPGSMTKGKIPVTFAMTK